MNTQLQKEKRKHPFPLWIRWFFTIMVILILIGSTVLWIIQGSQAVISLAVLTALGILIAFFQLLPLLFPAKQDATALSNQIHFVTSTDIYVATSQRIEAERSVGQHEAEIKKPSQQYWNVPYRRNPFFTGREESLQSLHDALLGHKQIALTQAISGLGGIGKTQTALEYTYRYRDKYLAIFWARADSRETLLMDIANIASVLNLPEKQEQDQYSVVDAVKRWMSNHNGWLLVLDNIEELELTEMAIPLVHKGSVLLTTRAQVTEPFAQSIEMETMNEEEGAFFLLKRAKMIEHDGSLDQASVNDLINARALTCAMDGLPLALDQAGAYILETTCSLSNYLNLYQEHHAALLKRRGKLFVGHPASVTTTFSLAFKTIEQRNRHAINLLSFCAFLHPDAIPEKIFTLGATHLHASLNPIISDPLAFNEAVEALLTFSLVRRNANLSTLSMHRLVQVVLKDEMNERNYRQWAEQAVRVINEAFPDDARLVINWLDCHQFLPHVQVCEAMIRQIDMYFPEAARLLNKAGAYLHERGLYTESEAFIQHALRIYKRLPGLQHLDTACCLHDLAIVYWEQGKYTEAEPLTQQALSIRKHHLGSGHPDTIASMSILAEIYNYQGRYTESEQLELQALTHYEQLETMSNVEEQAQYINDYVGVLNDIGWLYHTQGRYEEAEQPFLRALSICEQRLDPQTLKKRFLLSNLGMLYRDQGRFTEAEAYLQQALLFVEQHLGLDHPAAARNYGKLGKLYYLQGKYEKAEQLLLRALAIFEQYLKPQHLYIAETINDLGAVYRDQKKYEKAETHFQRALEQLGPQHPQSAHIFKNMAILYSFQERYQEADLLFQRALELFELHLSHHPALSETLENYKDLQNRLRRQ